MRSVAPWSAGAVVAFAVPEGRPSIVSGFPRFQYDRREPGLERVPGEGPDPGDVEGRDVLPAGAATGEHERPPLSGVGLVVGRDVAAGDEDVAEAQRRRHHVDRIGSDLAAPSHLELRQQVERDVGPQLLAAPFRSGRRARGGGRAGLRPGAEGVEHVIRRQVRDRHERPLLDVRRGRRARRDRGCGDRTRSRPSSLRSACCRRPGTRPCRTRTRRGACPVGPRPAAPRSQASPRSTRQAPRNGPCTGPRRRRCGEAHPCRSFETSAPAVKARMISRASFIARPSCFAATPQSAGTCAAKPVHASNVVCRSANVSPPIARPTPVRRRSVELAGRVGDRVGGCDAGGRPSWAATAGRSRGSRRSSPW